MASRSVVSESCVMARVLSLILRQDQIPIADPMLASNKTGGQYENDPTLNLIRK